MFDDLHKYFILYTRCSCRDIGYIYIYIYKTRKDRICIYDTYIKEEKKNMLEGNISKNRMKKNNNNNNISS